MRDLERIEERSSDDNRGVLILSGVGLLAAIGIVLAAVAALPGDAPETQEDPLQTLILAEGTQAKPAKVEPAPELDPKSLAFPTTLVTASRPEVAAAVAAASAELAHLDPLTKTPARSNIAAGLPAAVTAGPDREVVEQAVTLDPLMAATLPQDAAETAPAGREGLYTLQVVSYREPSEARLFAEALRKRGHTAYVAKGVVEGRGTHWRVRIGPFESRRDAENYRRTFEREEGMNTFVVRRRSS